MDIFVWTLLLVAALKVGWGAAKIFVVFYERRRDRKMQNDLFNYLNQNKIEYEKKQTEETRIKNQELPKRD